MNKKGKQKSMIFEPLFPGKKGIGVGQVFIFITAALVMGVVMIFGFKVIAGMISGGEELQFIEFKNTMEKEVKKLHSNYDAVRTKTFRVPTKYTKICFVNLEYGKSGIKKELSGLKKQKISLAYTTWKDAMDLDDPYEELSENVFLKPAGEKKIKLFNFKLSDIDQNEKGYVCKSIKKGRFDVIMVGKGDHTQITFAE